MKKEGSILKNTMVLVIMTLILGAILGTVHYITEEPIAAQNQKKHDEALTAVLSDAESFETLDLSEDGLSDKIARAISEEGLTADSITEVNVGKDSGGEVVGHVYSVTSTEGYGGEIDFTLGVDKDGAITGISYLTLNETAGLGQRARNESFVSQFIGKNVEKISYSKTGASGDDEIDALSGSTITTNAVVNGVNAGLAADRVVKEGEN